MVYVNEKSDHQRNSFELGRLYRLASKELVEILRDRRTIITLVLMPLLVYPLMGIVVQKLILQTISSGPQDTNFNIGFESEDDVDEFSKLIVVGERAIRNTRLGDNSSEENDERESSTGIEQKIKETLGAETEPTLTFLSSGGESLELLIKDRVLDLGVIRVNPDGRTPGYKFVFDPSHEFSIRALRHIQKRFRYANEVIGKQILSNAKSPIAGPVWLREIPVESGPSQPILLTFVPLMLVLMTITGAVYPAIDLTAGERERGTMEILVAAPVSRLVVLFGKFVAVLAVAILTAIANLVAMSVTIYALGLDSLIFGEAVFTFPTLVVIFILLVVLAAFFSATLLCLTSFARSFKEAQAYLIPLMLVAFAPGLISLNPNLATTSFLSVIPLVNIVLAGRDLLAGQANSFYVAISVFSTVIYGLVALSLAARIFGTDSILTGGRSSWSDLFAKNKQHKLVPDMQSVMLFLAILFPAFVVVSGVSSNFATKSEMSVMQRLLINSSITILLFVGLPYLVANLSRFRLKTSFFLFRPSVGSIVAAVFLGCSVWVLVYELEVATLDNERLTKFVEIFESMKAGLMATPLWLKLVCLAMIPAVCEEFTFRGFLLSALERRMTWGAAVIITALLFGLFHVFLRGTLTFERLLPSTTMGLLLGVLCIRSGSIFPGMLLHFVHNGMLVTLAHYENRLGGWGIDAANQKHLPAAWIAVALILMLLGLLMLFLVGKTGSAKTTNLGAQANTETMQK